MIYELILQALSSEGFTVVAFLVAIVALWRGLRDANTSRIVALETAVKECTAKHDACERRNRVLTAAMVDMLENRGQQAMIKCQALLEG